jgi:hypothetical protein
LAGTTQIQFCLWQTNQQRHNINTVNIFEPDQPRNKPIIKKIVDTFYQFLLGAMGQ